MTNKERKIRKFIMELLNEVDYDISKQYDEETAECPEEVEGYWEPLLEIANRYIKELY